MWNWVTEWQGQNPIFLTWSNSVRWRCSKAFLTHLGTDGTVSKGRRERTAGCRLGFLPSHTFYSAIFQHQGKNICTPSPQRGGAEEGKRHDERLHYAKLAQGGKRGNSRLKNFQHIGFKKNYISNHCAWEKEKRFSWKIQTKFSFIKLQMYCLNLNKLGEKLRVCQHSCLAVESIPSE